MQKHVVVFQWYDHLTGYEIILCSALCLTLISFQEQFSLVMKLIIALN